MGIGWDGEEHQAQRRDLKRRETGKRMDRGEEEENVARGGGGGGREAERKAEKVKGEESIGGMHSEMQTHAAQSPGWPESLIS